MNKKSIKLFLFATLGLFFLNGCMKDSDELLNDLPPQAFFTMINAYEGSDFVIHKADNNFIQTMNNPLLFKAINFVYLYPGNRKIQTIDKQNNIIIDSTFTIKDESLYTSIIFRTLGNKAGQHLIVDSLVNNLATNSALRFLNLAEGTHNINVFLSNTAIISNRNFDGTTADLNHFKFVPQQSGFNKIIIKDESNQTLIEKDINLAPGIHYTIALIKSSIDENKYEIIAHQQYRN
ncbi:DUF4397 domain-containing protein [Sphingobacterium bovistauri]|uniref:DUF4397 domain-containing protein n=1 Tax=Sphingobacterium bovistauri TaxID=2781959 RepID=A0ABS7Z890_9SPHI|nr:DUF4397 domain-containing protein [Sphingobacterium bovistauri]MCA5005757.1 DUF4397 domain-containing protein [Sphingobacterium bovistauri]